MRKYIQTGLLALTAVPIIAGCSNQMGSKLKLDEFIGRTPKPYAADFLNQCGRQFYIESNGNLFFYETGRKSFPAKLKFDSEGNVIGVSSKAKYSPELLEGITELRLVDVKSNSWEKGLENNVRVFTEEDVMHRILKNKLVIDDKEYGILCSEDPQKRDKYGKPVNGGYGVYIFDKDDFSGYTISDNGDIIVELKKVSELVPFEQGVLGKISTSHKNNLIKKKKPKNKKKKPLRIEKDFFDYVNCDDRGVIVYPVQEGDTLPKVAKKLDVNPDYIKNNLYRGKIGKKWDTLYRGDILKICGSSCRK